MSGLAGIVVEFPFGEAILDGDGEAILDGDGEAILDSDWVDVTAYTVDDPIPVRRGCFDTSPTGRVADTGTLKLTLNNSAYNPASKLGYFSPDNANLASVFANGMSVRLNLVRTAGDYYKFQGKIINIKPEPGLLSQKRCWITVADWVDVAARTPLPLLPVQEAVTDDQVVQAIVDAMNEAPDATDLDPGGYEYDYALTDVTQDTKVLGVLQSLALSGLGRFFMIGGETSGGILAYRSLYTQFELTTPAVTLDNEMLDMSVDRSAYTRIRQVIARVFPMRADSSPTALFSLAQTIRIAPGATVTFRGEYQNSSNKQGPAINVITPIAVTDYSFSSVDGSGHDLNGDLAIAFQPGPTYFEVSVVNNGTSLGYLWDFNVRGTFLDRSSALEYSVVDPTLSERDASTLTYDMPYQTDYYVGADFGNVLLLWNYEAETKVDKVKFNGGQSATLMDAAVTVESGDIVKIIEDVTGIERILYVLGYELVIRALNDVECEWTVISAQSGQFATLDVDGLSELDTDAVVLGI